MSNSVAVRAGAWDRNAGFAEAVGQPVGDDGVKANALVVLAPARFEAVENADGLWDRLKPALRTAGSPGF